MKASHASVNYGPGQANGAHCAVCKHYQVGLHDQMHCELVVDPIRPEMWCKLFSPAKGKAMPSESQAQNRFMHAVAEGKVKGVKPSVGEDFVAADHGRKIGKLPKHVRKAHKRGLISDKQMAKMRDA